MQVVGGPGGGCVRMSAQRADTEVRAPATLNLEYGAVRRFSFIGPRRAWVDGDVPPGGRVFDTQAGGLRHGRWAAPGHDLPRMGTPRRQVGKPIPRLTRRSAALWDKFENLSGA
jgi:hypothetical protein